MPRPLRLAILGTGWAASEHAKRLRQDPDVAIVAVIGRTRERAAALAQAHGAVAHADLAGVIAHERLDACYVCLPPFAHAGQVEALAAAGIPLFLEKPIAADVAHGERMAAAVAASGVPTQVGFHMRHGAASRALKQRLVSGEAGRPTVFQGTWWSNHLHSAWWREDAKSGGQLVEQAIHLYDLALWYCGPAVEVTTVWDNLCHRHVSDYTVDDTSASLIRFASGAMATVVASNCAIPWEWSPRWTLVCQRLTATCASPNDGAFVATDAEAMSATRWQETRAVDPYLAETQEFLAALRGGPPPGAPITDGLAALRLVHAARQSAIRGQPVALAERDTFPARFTPSHR